MIVVADTSPLNYLILIEQIQVLEALYRQVIIPPAVQDELLGTGAPVQVRRWIESPPGWLEVRSPLPTFRDTSLLGPGEGDAIALAEQLGADRIMMDETVGRSVALSRGLQIIGTLGVLRDAHRAGLLDLATSIERLRATSFRASPQILQSILESVRDLQ
jgi:predicted nucleic acid-binding protein